MRSDEKLAEDFGAGDPSAYALLYDRYRRPLFLFGARMLGNGEAARDLVQDTFLTVFERRGELRGLRSFRGWLFTLARNRCLTLLRTRQTRSRLEATLESGATGGVPEALEAREEGEFVRRAIAGMRPEFREVLVLREYQELSYREIAEITESTESAVKTRLFRARQALHEALRLTLAPGENP
jgi:RNA polymerase sigma-70 factor (ECF subfamily)